MMMHAVDEYKAQGIDDIKQDWASASISIIYKIGKYKEKRTKDVDTSRMGVN